MKKKKTTTIFIVLIVLALVFSIVLHDASAPEGDIKEAMKDAVLHETNKVSLLGIMEVNPAVIGGFVVTGLILIIALIIRIVAIPKFSTTPTKIQVLLEKWVELFDDMAKSNSPHRHSFLSYYIFAAGSYIFLSTIFELFGLQVVATNGHSITLPAPLADINGAISMAVISFFVIMSGGVAGNGIKGVFAALKDFSLPISMSFRLFGALLSGLLVTDLVYHSISLSFVLPVFVAVLFTLVHALVQAYVLTMLTSVFYGGASEKKPPKEKKQRKSKRNKTALAEG